MFSLISISFSLSVTKILSSKFIKIFSLALLEIIFGISILASTLMASDVFNALFSSVISGLFNALFSLLVITKTGLLSIYSIL